MARQLPVTYMVFDQLFTKYRSLMEQPLSCRRQALRQTLAAVHAAGIVLSEGVVGPGCAFYQQVVKEELEGVVAKRLESRYRPARRGQDWLKIKPR